MSRLRQFAAILALLAVAAVVIGIEGRVPVADRIGVRMDLPAMVGDAPGEAILFCQEERCGRAFIEKDIANDGKCPACGGELAAMSLAEKGLLPPDTVVLRRQYRRPNGRTFVVSIVISGGEQKSIHRPQQCLPAQGSVIERTQVIEAPLGPQRKLGVMLLDLRPAAQGTRVSGRGGRSCYAYWFVGADRETPDHRVRLFWMSVDRVFRRMASRWAYVAVVTERLEGSQAHVGEIQSFVARLHPLIVTAQPPRPREAPPQ